MTLFRQLIIAVILLFILLYAGNTVVSLFNTRTLVEQQMQVHAQDTATSVALSMTQAAQENDIASLDTLFNAVSDSGFYQRIYFRNLDGEVVINRRFPVKIEGVPDWFVGAINLSSPEGRAEVNSGWVRLGEVVVISHPGQAYKKLWSVIIEQLAWFLLVTVLVSALAYVAIRWLLVPLRRVEEQAIAICDQQFPVQKQLPQTRELRQVVEAMNRMSIKLKQVFNDQLELIKRLQIQSYRDTVTGLSNRADFDARLNSLVRDEAGLHSGLLLIVGVADFAQVNDLAGREEGNSLLKAFGDTLAAGLAAQDRFMVARRQGPEFSVFVPDITEQEARHTAEDLFRQLKSLNWQHQETVPLILHMGYTYQDKIDNGPELLSEADMALRQARTQGDNQGCCFNDLEAMQAPLVSKPAMDWKAFIERVIAERRIQLHYQPMVLVPERKLQGWEVFARFCDEDNLLSAAIVIPLAERFGLAESLDRLVLETLASEAAANGRDCYSVNLSGRSLLSQDFIQWLAEFLAGRRGLAKRLVVEVAEHAMQAEEHQIRSLQAVLAKEKAGLAIDHFGLETSAFAYIGSLPLRYLKIHRSFIKQVQDNPDNQFYIKSLAQLAHSRDISLVAEGVETEDEWIALQGLGVDWAQGFWIGKPEPVQTKP